jgi:hypothetical protein
LKAESEEELDVYLVVASQAIEAQRAAIQYEASLIINYLGKSLGLQGKNRGDTSSEGR